MFAAAGKVKVRKGALSRRVLFARGFAEPPIVYLSGASQLPEGGVYFDTVTTSGFRIRFYAPLVRGCTMYYVVYT